MVTVETTNRAKHCCIRPEIRPCQTWWRGAGSWFSAEEFDLCLLLNFILRHSSASSRKIHLQLCVFSTPQACSLDFLYVCLADTKVIIAVCVQPRRFVWLYITSENGRISRLSKNGEEKVAVLTQEGLWFFFILLSQLRFRHSAVCKFQPVNRRESSMWDVSAKSPVTFSSTEFFSPTFPMPVSSDFHFSGVKGTVRPKMKIQTAIVKLNKTNKKQ